MPRKEVKKRREKEGRKLRKEEYNEKQSIV